MSLDGVHGHQAFAQSVGCSRQTKVLGERIVEVLQAGPLIHVLDNTAGWLTKRVNRLGLAWVGVLHPNTTDHDRNRRQKAASLGHGVRLKERARLQLRARICPSMAPSLWSWPGIVTGRGRYSQPTTWTGT